MRRVRGAAGALWVGLIALLGAGCGEPLGLLLTVRAEAETTALTVLVKDLEDGQVLLRKERQPVAAGVDPAEGLRVALEVSRPGSYLVYLRGHDGGKGAFFLAAYAVQGTVEETVELLPLARTRDRDGDGFPACGTLAERCPPLACAHLDCDDSRAAVNPFAAEACGDGVDNDCSAGCGAAAGAGDQVCADQDNDGVAANKDCDDNDPCRSPLLEEAKNLCGGAAATFPALPAACQAKLKAAGKTASPPYCGDGVDQDCDGKDEACVTDGDCDGYAPPADCDDADKAVNPGAKEVCDSRDNNCDKRVDEGCLPCDVDGDGYGSKAAKAAGYCSAAIKARKDDPDDYDAGIHPGTTANTGGKEGGTRVLTALRRWCSARVESKNSSAGKRIYNRDVDHDGDGRPASADCPPAACDADGDGFQRKSAACSPPASQVDCDDKDPFTFPGAPDDCTDKVQQNCVSAPACSKDSDGDGYQGSDDCNDQDKTVHPWAPEVCNGVDDDCDGLIDEGNPAATATAAGQVTLLSTLQNSCNDSTLGRCATCDPKTDSRCDAKSGLSGVCACSPLLPLGYKKDASGKLTWPTGSRVSCTGEDLRAPASPRCFGATQPQKERCDTTDHDCDGESYRAGQDFVGKGQSCSKTVGACQAGTVSGCKLTAPVPDFATVQAFDPGFASKYWVCSGVLPRAERCNGVDDDCDGKLGTLDLDKDGKAESSEKDADGDHHIYCQGGCSFSEARFALAKGLDSCRDCDDAKAAIHPQAQELCDGVDNNCNGVGDEGKDQCGPLNKTCCAAKGSYACADLNTDAQNCGTCGKACSAAGVDRCVGGKCVCGGTGGACGAGLNCVSGSCRCVQGSAPAACASGCCATASTCYLPGAGLGVSHCGVKGGACVSCDDNKSCTQDSCLLSSGTCKNATLPAGAACNDGAGAGTCLGTACCTGCVSGGACQAGTSLTACGSGGGACQSCTAASCYVAECTNDPQKPCSTSKATLLSSCTDSSGRAGTCGTSSHFSFPAWTCCSGCWHLDAGGTPDYCYPGTSASQCGGGGNTCKACQGGQSCVSGVCQ